MQAARVEPDWLRHADYLHPQPHQAQPLCQPNRRGLQGKFLVGLGWISGQIPKIETIRLINFKRVIARNAFKLEFSEPLILSCSKV